MYCGSTIAVVTSEKKPSVQQHKQLHLLLANNSSMHSFEPVGGGWAT